MGKVMAIEQKEGTGKIHPQKFGLYLGIVSLIMTFAAMSSAYMVRQAAGNWLEFRLPNMFFVSTGFILLSSICLRLSSRAFDARKEKQYKNFLLTTFILGIGFLICQYLGWNEMYAQGIELRGNPSGSFVYIMSFLHAFHVLGGIAILGVALYHAFKLPFRVTENRRLRFDLTGIYWHFVDLLWIYLLVFFIIQR